MNKGGAKRQLILDAAYYLFREQRFKQTSISEITARAGGSKATVYAYFESKELLFAECLLTSVERSMTVPFAALNLNARDGGSLDIEYVIQQFGVDYLRFISSAEMVASRRLMYADASRLGFGRMLYDNICALRGDVECYLSRCMDYGVLRSEKPH